MGIKSNQGRKGAEDTFDFLLAGRNVLLGTLRECKGLGERADRLRSLLPLERFAHDVRTGCDAIVSIRCEGPRVALASNARAEHAEACHAWHLTYHMVQVQIHVVPRLVQVLNMFDRPLAQMVAMAQETAELADVLRRMP